MKKINSIIILLLLTASVFLTQQATAQAPQRMSYQSVIRNSSNVLLVSKQVGIKISILQGTVSGNAVYTETQTPTTNANGLVSIQIGSGTADLTSIIIPGSVTSIGNSAFTTGSFADIDWANGPYFIKTETDPSGGSNYSITGTQEILSVPYAMYAAKSVNDSAQTAAITVLQTQIAVAADALPTIQIGTQKWQVKNLDVAFYRNGDPIPQVKNTAAWAALTTGAWCWFNNDSTNGNKYGKLYNWYAVNDVRGLAPQGWHIPSDAEWTTLSSTTLGGDATAGGQMKEAGTLNWTTPNIGGNNSSGFAGLPGGYRHSDGTFYDVGDRGYWWSATENFTTNAWCRFLYNDFGNLSRGSAKKTFGFSVRCLRD